MSNRVLNWVFEQSPTTGNDRLVLIAIADEADDDGTNAYPSIDRIVTKARVNKRTTMRCLERLESGGHLVVHRPETRGRGHFNTYVVLMKKGDILAPIEKARNGDSGDEERRGKARDDAQSVLDPMTLGTEVPAPSARLRRASRLPEPFLLEDDMGQWAADKVPLVNIEREHAKFVNYWRAKAGKDAAKIDWRATWRNWMLTAQERAEERAKPRVTPTREQQAAEARTAARRRIEEANGHPASGTDHRRDAVDVPSTLVGRGGQPRMV